MTPRRLLAGAGVTAVVLAGLAACSKPPSPDGAARTLAEAVQTGSFSSVTWHTGSATSAAADWKNLTAPLTGVAHTVTVSSVTPVSGHSDQATATLASSWRFSAATDGSWHYTTTAALTLVNDSWQVDWSPAVVVPDATSGEKLQLTWTQPKRADITGAGGATIVTARPVFRVGIDKTRVSGTAAASAARALAALVGVDAGNFTTAVTNGGPKQFVVAITLRADDPLVAAVRKAAPTIPGTLLVPATLPLAPTRDFARAVLGTVGPATAQIVADSKGAVRATDEVGLNGLQAAYDSQLRGTDGVSVAAVSTTGGATTSRPLFTLAPVPGTPLATTLDPAMERAAEKALAGTRTDAALVAIRPSTGQILAMANGPATNGLEVAGDGRFPPGSTFKIASSLALLRAGLTPTSTVPCTPTITVDGRTFSNDSGYPASQLGQITLTTALANSCNTAFLSQYRTVSQDQLAQAAASLGLGGTANLGFAAYLGQVPAQATSQTDHAASLMGQGRVLASPLAMATVVASVMHGSTVTPQLLTDHPPTPLAPAVPLTAQEAATLRTMMQAVVTRGTASGIAASGASIAKTGTAQYQSGSVTKNDTWLVAGRGDLAVAVLVKDGDFGATTCGPIVTAFLDSVPRT